ncbi:hypothetical protein GCM10010124_13870 [Pilimelia terevasa]|uniref:Uncharacterized protein n=1 Tax=Pilimelia terevasa TaxID=53372 RepID=A0A8J3BMY6_9ACTN|nr:hypothetical protein [Pilimelia terevasa]GGK22568.1 hypothetical protein GCM10010124_13870 [Pilimelia terevasa]
MGDAHETANGPIDALLDSIFAGQERLSRADIYQHAVAADLPADALVRLDQLPEGEYTVDEAGEALTARR